MAALTLRGLGKRFGDADAVRDVDLEVADGAFLVFVGPSGCGKSTLLRLIAGLEDPTAGELLFDGRRVDHLPPARRGVAMVFQSYALYPHMTVYDNMAFGIRRAGLDRRGVETRVRAAADTLQIAHLLDRKPKALSGGQRQRVAIGRAIVREPRVFLFDEPLSNLDAALRVQMRVEIKRLHAALSTTMIYVTHDQVEAMTLADRMVVLNDGVVEQVGAPLDLYHRPCNRFVAGFIGSPRMNFLDVTADAEGTVSLPAGGRVTVPAAPARGGDQPLTLGIRPEHVVLGGDNMEGRVVLVERLGSGTLVHLELADGTALTAATDGMTPAQDGERLGIGLPPASCHLFDDAGQALERPTGSAQNAPWHPSTHPLNTPLSLRNPRP